MTLGFAIKVILEVLVVMLIAYGIWNDPLATVDCTFAYCAESPPHDVRAAAGTSSHIASDASGIPIMARFSMS